MNIQEFSEECNLYGKTAIGYKQEDINKMVCAHDDRMVGRKYFLKKSALSGETYDCEQLRQMGRISEMF